MIDSQTAGVLAGEINTAYLWGIGQQYNLPPLTQLTIMNPSGDVLISSIPDSAERIRGATLSQRNTSSHHFTWQNGQEDYLGCYWDLFLKSRFEAANWIITLSQSREDALSPLQNFKFDFLLSLLVGFWIILLVSIRFIRKSLVPLEKLQEGTRRIRAGDFSGTVTLRSRDEFEDLADSFNLMTDRLALSFGELSVMAEMGQLVTTGSEANALVAAELRIMADKLHFDWGLLMIQEAFLSGDDLIAGFGIADTHQKKRRQVVSLDGHPGAKALLDHAVSHRTILLSNDIRELTAHLPPACLTFLKQIGCRSLLCVPIMFESHQMGVLAVGQTLDGPPLTDSDKDLIASIAAQTAVAVNSIVAYHKLQDSEARFRQAFDHAATGILLVDPEQRIKASNRYIQQLLGYREEELAEHVLADILSVSDPDEIENIFAVIVTGKAPLIQLEKSFIPKTGETIPTRLNGSLLRDTLGQPLQFILHIQDLSTEKAAEQHKRQLEGQLRQAQKMEAIGTLAGGIAHDFNNILSAVSGYTELALMQLPTESEIRGHLSNTGCGMDALTRERIFDPYFTTKTKGKGTGLGLSLVHGIVQNHGGMIKVISAVGQGTTFEVYFPVLENQALHDNPEVEDLPRGSECVLFIDDEPMLVSLGESMLGRLGYHVVGMSDPHEALEVFRRSPEQFDIVITDLTMPGISGEKLAGMLSNIKPHIPILLCSGYVKHAGSQPFLSGYIRKPITVQRLARTVRETLDS